MNNSRTERAVFVALLVAASLASHAYGAAMIVLDDPRRVVVMGAER